MQMSEYFGVSKVQEIGQRVDLPDGKRQRQPLIPVGKSLIAVVGNGLWKIAPDVTDLMAYEYFRESHEIGVWATLELYLLTHEQLCECPDEGLVYNSKA